MTVSSQTSRNEFNGNGTTDTFAYTFRILDEDHIAVYVDGAIKTITTHYTVTGVGDSGGGSVVFVTPPPVGIANVVMVRSVPMTQETDYVENDPFHAKTHEDALDKLTMIVQQQQEQIDRTPAFAITSTSEDITFPEPSATDVIGWNAAGTALENKTLVSISAADLSTLQPIDATLTSLSALGTAGDKIAYTTGVDTWAETPLTAAARTVLDDTTVAAMLATLGGAALAANTFTGLQVWKTGANIASATTVDLTTATGNLTHITGTTPTTGVTMASGQWMRCIADAAWPLTYHATNLRVNGGVSYTCTAGDTIDFFYDGTTLFANVTKKDGTAVVTGGSLMPVSQTVLSGLSTTGIPAALVIGTGLAVNLAATATPLIMNGANGFNVSGEVNQLEVISADATGIVTLPASNTSYIYRILGTSWASTTLAPIYQASGTPAVTNGQYTYNWLEKKGYLGNGTTAPQVIAVFVGEAVTSGVAVTSVTTYAYQGDYDSGLVATLPGLSTSVSFNHNVGTKFVTVIPYLECISTDLSYAVGDRVTIWASGNGTWAAPPSPNWDRLTAGFQTCSAAAFIMMPKTGGAQTNPTATKWKYGCVVTRRRM